MSNYQPSASESSADSDQDFDPTAEMLINDFDDEHTLEEEEANEDSNNINNEIMDLQKEGEMPLEQLLALYGYEQTGNGKNPEKTDLTLPSDGVTGESNSNCSYLDGSVANASHDNQCNASTTARPKNYEGLPSSWNLPQSSSTLPNTNLGTNSPNDGSEIDDDEEEEDLSDNVHEWMRTIQVGSDYQASVPDGLCEYGDVPPYENEDKQLWDPTVLNDDLVFAYLKQIASLEVLENLETNGEVSPSFENLPANLHIKDDEQALYLLHQCGHNTDEALRRRRMQQNNIFQPMSSWSEEECNNFEEGIRVCGKDFHQIQRNKVPTRSVGELVQFYYLWKKTERHDMYASKYRIEKKKYSLHPGTTDYMDRFLDEQENLALQAHSLVSTTCGSLQPYTRQQSHGSYSIIQYNHLSSQNQLIGNVVKDSNIESRNVPVGPGCRGICSTDSTSGLNGLRESTVQIEASNSTPSKINAPSSQHYSSNLNENDYNIHSIPTIITTSVASTNNADL